MTCRPEAAQIRGARAMLGWSMADLAAAAGVSVSTIKRIDDANRAAVSEASERCSARWSGPA